MYAGNDFESVQDLIESVYEFLEKMASFGTRDPIEFAQLYKQSLEAMHRDRAAQTPAPNAHSTNLLASIDTKSGIETTSSRMPNVSCINSPPVLNVNISSQIKTISSQQQVIIPNTNSARISSSERCEDRIPATTPNQNSGNVINPFELHKDDCDINLGDAKDLLDRQNADDDDSNYNSDSRSYSCASSSMRSNVVEPRAPQKHEGTSNNGETGSKYSSGYYSNGDTLSMRLRQELSLSSRIINPSGSECSSASASPIKAHRECSACNEAPVGVLFDCGHCCVCLNCLNHLIDCT